MASAASRFQASGPTLKLTFDVSATPCHTLDPNFLILQETIVEANVPNHRESDVSQASNMISTESQMYHGQARAPAMGRSAPSVPPLQPLGPLAVIIVPGNEGSLSTSCQLNAVNVK